MIPVQDLGNHEKEAPRGVMLKPQPCPGPSLWARQEEVMTWEAVGLGLRTWRCSTFLQQATIGPFRSSLEALLPPPTVPLSQTSTGGASRLNKEVNLAS